MGRKEKREEGGTYVVLRRREKARNPLKGPTDNARCDCDSKSCIVLFNPARSWRRWKPVDAWKGLAIGPSPLVLSPFSKLPPLSSINKQILIHLL